MLDNEARNTNLQTSKNLTPRQLAMWAGCQLAPDTPVYNMVMVFEFNGHVKTKRFRKAFNSMLATTDSLRTTFHVGADGTPKQLINSITDYQVKRIDLRQSNSADYEAEDWISRASTRAVDLSKICFSSALIQKPGKRTIWFLCQHHLITDGWSSKIIYDRVRSAYANPAALSVSSSYIYHDYLQQQAVYQSSDQYKLDQQYWEDKLEAPVEPLRLYDNTHHYAPQTRRLSVPLGEARSQALIDIGRKSGALSADMAIFRLFTTILFAYLHLVSGNKRIGLGVPMHNRPPKYRQVAGLMMEVCPLVIDFEEDETFDSLSEKVSREMFNSVQHSKYCIQNSIHARIFDVSLNFLNPEFKQFEGIKTRSEYTTGLQYMPDHKNQESNFVAGESLSVVVNDFSAESNYILDFDFNTGVYRTDTQHRAIEHFLKLVDAFITQSKGSIHAINLLSAAEKQSILVDLNQTKNTRARPSLIHSLERHALEQPQKLAAVFDQKHLDYQTLNERCNQLAHSLKALGIGPELSVGICMERSLDMLSTLIACMKCGGAYVPLDPHHPAERIELVLEDAKPPLLIVDESFDIALEVDPQTKILRFSELTNSNISNLNLDLALDENRLAYTIFTSGSTGRPKGVGISHFALNNFLHSMAEKPGMTPDDRLLSVTTISFDIAALELYLPLLTGATVEIADQESTLDPERLKLKLKSASFIQATPTTFRMLMLNDWQGDKSLRVLCGGEAFPRDLADQLLDKAHSVWNMYGPTETTIWSTIDKVDEDAIVPIGTPIDNTEVYVLNSQLTPVPQGCAGELYIAGSGLARGYHQRPDLTDSVFIPNPFSSNRNAKMYRTGDLARILQNGRLECLGRVDFQVKIRGFRIELGEIETLLGRRPEVEQAIVAVQTLNTQKTLVGYVSLNEQIETAVLQAYLKAKLPAYMVPSYIVKMDQFPLTPNGKINRKKLPMPVADDITSIEDYIEPTTEAEKTIETIWRDALGLDRVGVQTNFFTIGGHSLLALEVINKINLASEANLPLSSIFTKPTIRELAKEINKKSNGEEESASVTTLKKGNSGMPLFCICGIYLYQDLANQIDTDSAIYGVFLPQETQMWMDSSLDKRPTVQELASHYINAIKQVQPHGPYGLAGISFGGVLAYEIAQQLREQGEIIKTLALLDPILPRALRFNFPMMAKHQTKRVFERGVSYLNKTFARVITIPSEGRLSPNDLANSKNNKQAEQKDPLVIQRRQFYTQAIANYDREIKSYPGKALVFFSANSHNDFAGREVMECRGWSTVIENLDKHSIRGDHLGILQPPSVNEIAKIIETSLDRPFLKK